MSKDLTVPGFKPEDWAGYRPAHQPKERAATGNTIYVDNGEFSVGGQKVGNEIDAIVLGFALYNSFTTKPFTPGKPMPMECFSIGFEDEDSMIPDPSGPNIQHTDCAGCWANAFGSRGNGKACANRRVLALITPDNMDEPMLLTVPPTSLKNWGGFAMAFSKETDPPIWSVQTKINITDISGNNYKLVFEAVRGIKKKHVEAIYQVSQSAYKTLENYKPVLLKKEDNKKKDGKKKKKKGKSLAKV